MIFRTAESFISSLVYIFSTYINTCDTSRSSCLFNISRFSCVPLVQIICINQNQISLPFALSSLSSSSPLFSLSIHYSVSSTFPQPPRRRGRRHSYWRRNNYSQRTRPSPLQRKSISILFSSLTCPSPRKPPFIISDSFQPLYFPSTVSRPPLSFGRIRS